MGAFLAADGLSSTRATLEGNAGFFALYERNEVKPELLTDGLGRDWRVAEYSFKPYPCCRCNHTPIGIGIELHQKGIKATDVAAIEALEQRTAASVEELAKASDATTIERAAEVDWDMHQLIVGALRSQLIHDIYRQNRERQRLIGRVYAFHPAKHARAALVEHLPVLAALKARNAALGWELLEAHITSAMRRQIGI